MFLLSNSKLTTNFGSIYYNGDNKPEENLQL